MKNQIQIGEDCCPDCSDKYEFEGKWKDSFGQPDNSAKWFITGSANSGKSDFLFELSEILRGFGGLEYVSLDEGKPKSISDKIKAHGLDAWEDNFRLLPNMDIEDLKNQLLGKRSAIFAVIDCVHHWKTSKKKYEAFTAAFGNPRCGKSLFFICNGTNSDINIRIKHDADIKIEVIGFVARVQSRYGGNKPFIIWEQKAKEYWGKNYKKVIEGKYWPGQKK